MFAPKFLYPTLLLMLAASATAADYTLEKAESGPEGAPAEIAAQLEPQGHRVAGPKRELLTVWLARDLSPQTGFAPTATVKYPFAVGQFIGLIRVPRRADLTDFRGHEIEDGLYTLRYGRQPEDGNHIGTSDTADFLLALPAEGDASPDVLSQEALFAKSAEVSGTTHPAIFSLRAPEEGEAGEASLAHDEAKDFWILQLPAGTMKIPLRLVVVGASEG